MELKLLMLVFVVLSWSWFIATDAKATSALPDPRDPRLRKAEASSAKIKLKDPGAKAGAGYPQKNDC
ncbi:MAG: hypothetical protein K2X27_11440 [Candidatus Obscuribacterales bacterium]|nr:hypothetical protein [Candidatus Obscuribacterales bacterium]